MSVRRCLAGCLIAFITMAGPAIAQPGQNIAGTYRGLMVGCLSTKRSQDCRKGFVELIRLADEVDARRMEWEAAAKSGTASAAKMQEDLGLARTRLNEAVDKFNRDMSSSESERR
jgi:hypothetical protein